MQRYSVSQVTCVKAIAQLEKKGYIAQAIPGKPRRITYEASAKREHDGLLILLNSIYTSVDEEATLFQQIKDFWSDVKGPVSTVRIDFSSNSNPLAAIRSMLDRHGSSVILAHVPSHNWIDAFKELNLPYYVYGGEMKHLQNTGCSAYDFRMGLEKMFTQLKKLNHTRVMFASNSGWDRMAKIIVEYHQKVFGDTLTIEESRGLCPVLSENTPEVWQSYLKTELQKQQPTAIIADGLYQLISIYNFCAKYRINIPKDLSVVCADDGETIRWFTPLPTRISSPNAQLAKYFIEWADSNYTKVGAKLVPVTWIEGDTTREYRS